MRLLLLSAALLIAAATLWYVRRPHDREYAWPEPDDGLLHTWATDDPKLRVHLASDEDAIRAAWDASADWRCTRCRATGLYPGPV